MLLLLVLSSFWSPSTLADPCNTRILLNDLERRISNYELANGETPICDRYLDPGKWYYTPNVNMPTEAPSLFRCGTTYPIWLNGTLPTSKNENSTGQGCVVTPTSNCSSWYPVTIVNCGSHNVYFLQSTTACDQAYCFGNGIEDDPPTETLTNIEIVPRLMRDGQWYEITVFDCLSKQVGSLGSPFYQVTWTVNGESFLTNTASKDKLTDLLLKDSHLQKFDKTIACIVRPKNNINGKPGPIAKSPNYYVGVKVKHTTLTIKEGMDALIEFELTAPIGGLVNQGSSDGPFYVQMYQPFDRYDDNCTSNLGSDTKYCRTVLRKSSWNETSKIVVKYKGKDTVDPDFNTYILVLNVMAEDTVWNYYEFPRIQVIIAPKDREVLGKTCQSRNDPHMRTFDGRKYEHQYHGVFTLYKHMDADRPMEVQIKLGRCWTRNTPTCNCGVAVRAGGDVFIVDKCENVHKFEYRTCHDKLLDVRRQKTNERQYSIFFPTGTTVDITASIGYFNVDIRATFHDHKRAEGLCGFISDTHVDDFKHRNNSGYSTFWESWKVNENENMFSLAFDDKNISLWNRADAVCTCPTKDNGPDQFNCSSQTTVPCVRNKNYDPIGSKTCHEEPLRRKRSIEYPHKSFSHHREKRSSEMLPTMLNNVYLTEAEAYTYCEDMLGKSAVFKACNNVPNVESESSIQNCVLDIRLTNSTFWTQSTMESFKTSCFGQMISNISLEQEQQDEGVSVADAVKMVLCPGLPECSGNGQCINGTCNCDSYFISSDCSIDERIPPVMFGVRGDGLCDLSEIECDTAFVLGEDVGNSQNLSCSLHNYHITEDGQKTLMYSWIDDAKLETIMEVHCPLETFKNTRIKRNTETVNKFTESYELSISYDREHFGDVLQLTIYDSKCQIVDLDTNPPEYGLKKGTCFIGGKCYLQGEQHADNICFVCDPMYPYLWSTQKNIEGCQKISIDNFDKAWIAGPVVGGLLVFVIGFTLLILYKKRERAKVVDFK